MLNLNKQITVMLLTNNLLYHMIVSKKTCHSRVTGPDRFWSLRLFFPNHLLDFELFAKHLRSFAIINNLELSDIFQRAKTVR